MPIPARSRRLAGRLTLAALVGGLLGTPAARAEADGWSVPPRPVPAAAPASEPAAVPQAPIGLPRLHGGRACPALDSRLRAVLGGEQSRWSVTVADGTGLVLADINGTVPRVPASNQKLFSTAFALDRLGPDHRLTTRLWRLDSGALMLTGEGDPDLGIAQLQRLAKLALGQGGSSGAAPGAVHLKLAELPASQWWPAGWHPADRQYAYGAPITRLALTSNALGQAIANPAGRLRTLLSREITRQGGQPQLELVQASDRSPASGEAVLLHEEPSAPMHALLSLANSESHNFTSEVLLRQAAGTWNLPQALRMQQAWLADLNLPLQGVRLADGSGLDRGNRLTSRAVTGLLVRMAHHPYAPYYRASMAIAGQRGTLRSLYRDPALAGRFRGKTGTLRGVRSISGTLETAAGPRHISMIANGAATPNTTIGQLLRQTQALSPCPAPAAAGRPPAVPG
ncbi:D-alanyl-D-alanine carboxypeptidase [Synechococcus sp. RSCCF101]|uniref:D-alanyl-D-alanine carboxypeptidase/D-alanyl-D-alanine-endopeptidase n=1 Tax=Synechococcus sp. RSCCF101 TaxID=2511069 RepID=UPI0012475F44|nr:D-alanyl-D-alanine carboxypeptidase [Synechococcus sp. RSCCF101]QEY31718.1 D-alanyl-D-alanine carboxypeptidase [Synechococcus sp. RSCCF101]